MNARTWRPLEVTGGLTAAAAVCRSNCVYAADVVLEQRLSIQGAERC